MKQHRLILENAWLRVTILPYGATITSIFDKSLLREMVLGFDDDHSYVTSDKYFGCTIGRVANRISNGRFSLNGKEYLLSVNNGPNHLHGGIAGFDKQEFQCMLMDDSIECSYFSAAMEEGYPGNLEVKITYKLVKNQLHIKTYAKTDADTLVNLTNHTYFNLNPFKSSIADHRLKIHATRVYPVDTNGCTYNQPFNVKNTPFDFSDERILAECLASGHRQIMIAKGLDHHFDITATGLRQAAQLSSVDSSLIVYTDKPGIHVYTGNYLNGAETGFDDTTYHQHSGVCFEAQYAPNAINFDTALAPVVRAGQIQEHLTVFEFNRISEGKHEH
jgi:aldose 1-epimerase